MSGFTDESIPPNYQSPIHSLGSAPEREIDRLETLESKLHNLNSDLLHRCTEIETSPTIEPDEHLEGLSPVVADDIDVTDQLDDEDIESALAEFDAALEDMHL